MDERLFAQLAVRLEREPVVLASVRSTRGATPRKFGSRMLITADDSLASIGGGAAEASVLEAARALLAARRPMQSLEIDLSGRPGALGVCGGHMRIALRAWWPDADRARAQRIAAQLASGNEIVLTPADLGITSDDPGFDGLELHVDIARPDPRLLIVGAGHCGAALHELAAALDFDRWIFDARAACFDGDHYAGATRRSGDYGQLADAFDNQRPVYAVLLNRDFPSDVDTLRVLVHQPLAYLGMMGSRRRVAEVLAALPEHRDSLQRILQTPVGLDIDAHTPHEIAISILAQLVQVRRRAESARDG
jgi:xanthine dehydrogenase accessory factor